MRRDIALPLAAAGVAVASWALLVEPRRLAITRLELALPAWPPALDGLRVAVLSDLHAGAPFMGPERVGRLVARVQAEEPDLVALLGDFVDPRVKGGRRIAPSVVARRLARLRAPRGVWAVLGNHDWREGGRRVARALAEHSIRVLENEAAAAGDALWVAGLADARTRRPDVPAALEPVPPEAAVLVLAHDPDVFPFVPARAALTLCGHTHGGQVNLPGLRRAVIPSRHGLRYRAGHVVEGGRHLFVSRGVGTSGWPVRLLAPPEIAVLTLRSGG